MAGRAECVAISSVFAPVSAEHELTARDIVRKELGHDVPVSLSHEIGSIGLLERENATVLNAALTGVAHDVAGAFAGRWRLWPRPDLLRPERRDPDGPRVRAALPGPDDRERARELDPRRRLPHGVDRRDRRRRRRNLGRRRGPRNVPAESSSGVEIGGIQTNFRMPDLVTIAVGGGTIVRGDGEEVEVGPASVGYHLTKEALVFGGSTDAHGCCGGRRPGRSGRRRALEGHGDVLTRALATAQTMLAEADRVKTSREDRPLIAVGGGSILVPDEVPGVSEVHRPDHFDVANAIGAAIASASGEVDRIFNLGTAGREAAIAEASRRRGTRPWRPASPTGSRS